MEESVHDTDAVVNSKLAAECQATSKLNVPTGGIDVVNRYYHQLSQCEKGDAKRISQHLSVANR